MLPGLDWMEFAVVETGKTGEGKLVCNADLSRGALAEGSSEGYLQGCYTGLLVPSGLGLRG